MELIEIEWTEDKLSEFKKCMTDPIYFAEKYFLVRDNINGIMRPPKLHWYQKEILNGMIDHQFTAYSVARQNGKTMLCCIAALWVALFHPHHHIAILSTKEAGSENVNKIIRDVYNILPDFLQLTTERNSKRIISFSNGSGIITDTMSINAVRGMTLQYVFLDEFAYANKENSEEFYTSILPCLSFSRKSRLCVISTPSSKKHKFYDIFDKAERGQYKWRAARYPWSAKPSNDLEWKEQMQLLVGSEIWEIEYELQFSDK